MEEVYGGVSFNSQGLPVPAIMGRLCIWRTMRSPQTYATYQENQYAKTRKGGLGMVYIFFRIFRLFVN